MADRWSARMRCFGLAALCILGLGLAATACTISGSPLPQRELVSPDPRSVTNHPGAFPHRLNPGNNGTAYEPCNDANQRAVDTLGWDWSSRRDAATVDKQTARGCDWLDKEQGSLWGLSQIVGNSPSLDAYRKFNHFFDWMPDLMFDGRRVLVFSMNSGTCVARVQSGTAGVNTLAHSFHVPTSPMHEICARAIAFTRATIARMPE